MFENRRWLVIPVDKIDDIDFNQVLQPNKESLSISVDGTKTFIKYEVNIIEETYTETYQNPETEEELTNTFEAGTYGRPSIFSEEYVEYTHSEILELLSTEQWTEQIEE
ncbi:hypothetical protein N9J42_00835 [bacterium]|nr:hypothetical protein [bacterium]